MSTTTRTPCEFSHLPELMAQMRGDEKHNLAAESTLDALWVLYDQILDVSPARLTDPTRDRFLLSKGHGPSAFYAVLAAKGFVPMAWLPDFGVFDSPLGLHPDRFLVPGVEISSGSLGHGLPMAVGTALGLRAQGIDSRVIVMVGDAELDEGSNAEAVEFAAAAHLGSLTVVAIDNASATWGWRGGLETRFSGAGWRTARVGGRDHVALADAFNLRAGATAPNLVVADVRAAA